MHRSLLVVGIGTIGMQRMGGESPNEGESGRFAVEASMHRIFHPPPLFVLSFDTLHHDVLLLAQGII